MNPRATARFDWGQGMELLAHARNMLNPAKDCAIRNLDNVECSQSTNGIGDKTFYKERYLTAVFIVAMAIRNPKIPTSTDVAMWPKRSPA
jgi:hypothetical protein